MILLKLRAKALGRLLESVRRLWINLCFAGRCAASAVNTLADLVDVEENENDVSSKFLLLGDIPWAAVVTRNTMFRDEDLVGWGAPRHDCAWAYSQDVLGASEYLVRLSRGVEPLKQDSRGWQAL